MRTLTERQTKVLCFIEGFILQNNYSPTMREIAEYFKITVRAAHDYKLALERKGYINSRHRKSRTITIKETTNESRNN